MIRVLTGILTVLAAACWILPAAAKDFLYVPSVNTLQIIDCDSDTVVDSLSYNDYIISAMLSPDGKRYYLNAVHSIYVVDTETNTLVDTHKFSTELNKVDILGFSVSNDGKQLYLSCSIVKKKQNIPRLNVLPPQFVIYDLASRKMVKNHPIPAAMTGIVALRNDPDHVFLVGLDIHKLNLKTGEMEKMMGILNPEEGQAPKNSLVIWQNNSPDDHGLFTNPFYTPTGMGYFVIDKNTGTLTTLEAKDVWFAYSTVVSPDKKYLYAVMDELIKVDMATGETVQSVLLETGTNYVVSITSDGKKVYVGPAGTDISVYDAETLALKSVIPMASDGVTVHRLTKK
jgi:hypothetical protein